MARTPQSGPLRPDHDKAGRDHAHAVARSLVGKAARVRMLVLPGLADKGDASDWFAAGGKACAGQDGDPHEGRQVSGSIARARSSEERWQAGGEACREGFCEAARCEGGKNERGEAG